MRLRRPAFFALTVSVLFLAGCQKDDYIENQVPTADAGPSQSINLPVESVSLTGTGTDADGQVVAYLWSQVSGPAATTLKNPGSASATASGFIPGSYLFQLMVTDDKGATGVDTVSINVKAGDQTLVLQPANNATEVLLGSEGSQSFSHIAAEDIPVEAWTRNGSNYTTRVLLKFNLSAIPANATIVSANLYLYSYPAPTLNGNFTDANFGSNNAMLVQQVTANWSTPNLNFYAPPATTTTNQITAAHTSQSALDLNLDVKAMVSSMVAGNANYGFLLKLQNESTYTSRIFVSSHNSTHTTKFPKLVVVYK